MTTRVVGLSEFLTYLSPDGRYSSMKVIIEIRSSFLFIFLPLFGFPGLATPSAATAAAAAASPSSTL